MGEREKERMKWWSLTEINKERQLYGERERKRKQERNNEMKEGY